MSKIFRTLCIRHVISNNHYKEIHTIRQAIKKAKLITYVQITMMLNSSNAVMTSKMYAFHLTYLIELYDLLTQRPREGQFCEDHSQWLNIDHHQIFQTLN